MAGFPSLVNNKVIIGALAGAAGAAAMHGFRIFWRSLVGDNRKHGIFGLDREADVTSVQLLSVALLRRRIPEGDAEKIALVLHYGYGCAAGILYVLWGYRVPSVRAGSGTAFGGVLWLVGDEIPISVSGVSDPSKKSAASHASALGVHLLFGAVIESVASMSGAFAGRK